jgi:hypothetical protein
MIGELTDFLVIEKAFDLILHILHLNSYNCIAFYLLGGFTSLETLLYRLFVPKSELQQHEIEKTSTRGNITPR